MGNVNDAEAKEPVRFKGLWNPSFGTANSEICDEYAKLVLEQYKLYMETAENTSVRRLQTNAFFITLNTAILAGASFVFSESNSLSARLFAVGAVLAGVFLSLVWYRLIGSYRAINASKFEVLCELEQRLPSSPLWNEEWSRLHAPRKGQPNYVPLALLESFMPVLMLVVYVFVLIIGVLSIAIPSMSATSPTELRIQPLKLDVSDSAAGNDSRLHQPAASSATVGQNSGTQSTGQKVLSEPSVQETKADAVGKDYAPKQSTPSNTGLAQ